MERLTPVEQKAPGAWQIGTVTRVKEETPRVKSFRIELPMWMPHLPGQHYDVRLTAPDGYQAQRSYSVASSPLDEGEVELTIDRLDDGEVSPYFHDVVVEGDQVEIRGPFASYFVWRGESPALLDRRRLGGRPPDGDTPPPASHHAGAADGARLLGARGGGRDLCRTSSGRRRRSPSRASRRRTGPATPGASTPS